MDTDNVKHILWIYKMFFCGTKRAIPSVSGQDRPVFATQSQHSIHSACGVSDIILIFSGGDGFYFLLLALHMYVCMCSRFFENQPNEICSHLSEKPSKGRFLKPDKLQNHTNEGKGKEKKKEPGERKEEKRKKQWLHSWFL